MTGHAKKKHRSPQWLFSEENVPFGTFAVIDPFSRMLFVPFYYMHDTLAMHRPGVPSLCRLYMRGRCRQGCACFQAHADLTVISQLREAALKEPTCCAHHGARHVASGAPDDLELVVIRDGSHEEVLRTTLEYTARTKGLRFLLEQRLLHSTAEKSEALVVFLSSLCRLHTSRPCCRFGNDCNFLHLCREKASEIKEVKKEKRNGEENTFETQESQEHLAGVSVNCSPALEGAKPNVVLIEGDDGFNDKNSGQFNSSSSNLHSKVTAVPLLSLLGTPQLGTSPAMSRSHNSTSFGVLWQHNPYFAASSTSSFVET